MLSGVASSVLVYPRVLIQRQSLEAGPQSYCEYGDGSTGATFTGPIAAQPFSATPLLTSFPIDIGGSADCGGPVSTAGAVSVITVPEGYYDVFSTFAFLKP